MGGVIGPDGKEMDVLHVDIENLDGRTMRDEEIQVCILMLQLSRIIPEGFFSNIFCL